ncbi:hypothetical protein Efla_001092 [Eimeria flavescens]
MMHFCDMIASSGGRLCQFRSGQGGVAGQGILKQSQSLAELISRVCLPCPPYQRRWVIAILAKNVLVCTGLSAHVFKHEASQQPRIKSGSRSAGGSGTTERTDKEICNDHCHSVDGSWDVLCVPFELEVSRCTSCAVEPWRSRVAWIGPCSGTPELFDFPGRETKRATHFKGVTKSGHIHADDAKQLVRCCFPPLSATGE